MASTGDSRTIYYIEQGLMFDERESVFSSSELTLPARTRCVGWGLKRRPVP